MEKWLPPKGMTAKMLDFDFHEGGSYRMRLTFIDPQQGRGKTSGDSDEVEVRLIRLIEGERIEQAIEFDSEDPDFSGVMRMTWIFRSGKIGTLVTIRAENVPPGIRAEDHEAGMNATLENLESFLGSETF